MRKSREIYFFKVIRFFLFLLLAFFLLEILLRFSLGAQKNQNEFLEFLNHLQKNGLPQAQIYFVGDSTVFGNGASDSRTYSLPSQLETLMKTSMPEFKIANLGWPATCTEDHLDAFEYLPEGAVVIYRGGASDIWKEEYSVFRIGSFRFELLIIEAFCKFFPFLSTSNMDSRKKAITRRLKSVVERKKLTVFTIDYTTGRFIAPFYNKNDYVYHIPLRPFLEKAGFMTFCHFLPRFVSMNTSRNHSNDLGYFLEAMLIYNFFCQEKLFGLSDANQLPLEALDQFTDKIVNRYEAAKSLLKNLNGDEIRYLPHYNKMFLDELNSLGSILSHQDSEDLSHYKKEYEMLKRLLLLFFHDSSYLSFSWAAFEDKRPWFIKEEFSQPEIELYYAVHKATILPNLRSWDKMENLILDSVRRSQLRKISFLSASFSYPLEFCPRFIEESGFSAEELSVKREWDYFFDAERHDLLKEVPRACFR